MTGTVKGKELLTRLALSLITFFLTSFALVSQIKMY